MKLCKIRRTYGHELNIAPMIDIVFLLIIFFMTVSHILRLEVESISLPAARSGVDRERVPEQIIITVFKNGAISASGQGQTLASIETLLKERDPDHVAVLIRCDRELHWEHVRPILKICSACRITQVKVAVTKPGTPGGR